MDPKITRKGKEKNVKKNKGDYVYSNKRVRQVENLMKTSHKKGENEKKNWKRKYYLLIIHSLRFFVFSDISFTQSLADVSYNDGITACIKDLNEDFRKVWEILNDNNMCLVYVILSFLGCLKKILSI